MSHTSFAHAEQLFIKVAQISVGLYTLFSYLSLHFSYPDHVGSGAEQSGVFTEMCWNMCFPDWVRVFAQALL